MIGPSDLDTDTRFNNVLCAVMWDELLEGRVPELGPLCMRGNRHLLKSLVIWRLMEPILLHFIIMFTECWETQFTSMAWGTWEYICRFR